MGRTQQKNYAQAGFGLVQAMILSVALGALSLVVIQMLQQVQQTTSVRNATSQLKTNRSQLISTMQSEASWSRTLNHDIPGHPGTTIQQCLQSVAPPAWAGCPARPAAPRSINSIPDFMPPPPNPDLVDLALYSGDDTPFYDPTKPGEGFRRDGTPCHNFDINAKVTDCPFHMSYRWGFVCDPASPTCKEPIAIFGDLQVAASHRHLGINVSRFKIRELVVTEKSFIEHSCESMGGIYIPTATGSRFPADPSQAMVSIDSQCKCPQEGAIASLGCKTIGQILGSSCNTGQEIVIVNGQIECH